MLSANILLSHPEQLFAKSSQRLLFAHRAEPGGLFPVMRWSCRRSFPLH